MYLDFALGQKNRSAPDAVKNIVVCLDNMIPTLSQCGNERCRRRVNDNLLDVIAFRKLVDIIAILLICALYARFSAVVVKFLYPDRLAAYNSPQPRSKGVHCAVVYADIIFAVCRHFVRYVVLAKVID